jgi:hypothetical protein
MGIGAQKTINLNSESADFPLAPATNIPQEYLKEAKGARLFTINPALQHAESVNIGDVVILQLFEGKNYTATISNIVTDVNGTLALTLRLPDYPTGFVIITTSTEEKSLLTVSIPELAQIFGSRYSVDSNVNYLLEIDESKIERPHLEDDEITIPEGIEVIGNENVEKETNRDASLRSAQASCGPTYGTNTNDPATVSLLIVYTPAAATSSYTVNHGGINNVIALMIALGNTSLSNSQTGITLTLAHSAQITYTENNDMVTSLYRLQNPSDGYMDNVHTLRKQYNAALVQLLSTDNNSGGYGYLLGNTGGNYNYGFSVCYITQVADAYPCSVHEFGHNMGLGHGAQHIINKSTGIFSYSYGWRWTGTNNSPYGTNKYGSVMTYWSGGNYSDGIACYNVPYFSNPSVSYLGAATGDATQADAARSLREMKHVIAYYGDKSAYLPETPTNIVVSNPTNNGATFTWNACAKATGYRVCHPIGGGYSSYYTTNTTYSVNNSDWFPSQCTDYEFFIMALNECGDASSATLTFTTKCPVTGVTVNPTNVSLTSVGATQQLTATVAPANATNQTVTWSSNNPSVATVSTSGLVTAVSCGTATITVTTQDDNKTATCTVTNQFTINGSVVWNGSQDSDWTNVNNWSGNCAPNAESSVVISGTATHFPVLTSNTSVKTIRFQPGAQLGRQEKLSYEKAFVEYDFSNATGLSRDRWYMLSMPLQEAYPGDFYFGGYPKAWLRNFTINNNNGVADWQTAYGSTTPLTTGTGFIYWLDADDGADSRGLQASNGILRLPYFDSGASGVASNVHHQHDFAAGINGDIIGASKFFAHKATSGTPAFERDPDAHYTVDRHTSAYRLAGATVETPLNFAGENGRTGQMVIVGNPFMSTLSFNQLYASNNTKIKAGYQIWAGDYAVAGYHGYNDVGGGFGIVATSDLDEYIAPLQAFIVEKSDTYVVGDKLNFNTTGTGTNGGELRSATVETGNKLEITAANSAGAYRTFITQREGGSNTLSGKDSRILINSVSELPVVYTLKPSEEGMAYAGANIIPAGNREIPLGLLTSYSGELKFTFTGMDSYDSNIVLVDKTTGKETDLTGRTAVDYTFRHTPESQNGQTVALNDRFLLRITNNATGMEEVSRSIYIYSQGSDIRVISGSPIKSVRVYNLQGALVRVSHTNGVRDMAPGVYLVQVITGTDSKTAKVILKN